MNLTVKYLRFNIIKPDAIPIIASNNPIPFSIMKNEPLNELIRTSMEKYSVNPTGILIQIQNRIFCIKLLFMRLMDLYYDKNMLEMKLIAFKNFLFSIEPLFCYLIPIS